MSMTTAPSTGTPAPVLAPVPAPPGTGPAPTSALDFLAVLAGALASGATVSAGTAEQVAAQVAPPAVPDPTADLPATAGSAQALPSAKGAGTPGEPVVPSAVDLAPGTATPRASAEVPPTAVGPVATACPSPRGNATSPTAEDPVEEPAVADEVPAADDAKQPDGDPTTVVPALVGVAALPTPTPAPHPATPGADHTPSEPTPAEARPAGIAHGRPVLAPSTNAGSEHRSETGQQHASHPQPGTPAPAAPAMPVAATPGTGPVAAPVGTPPTAPAPSATGPSPQLDRVSAQVFPEVTGLVSRGPGTHRITLTLNPEQLGEVRVVMTMRSGAVHVRLAAGHDARAALLEGSPELSRLLEHAGATEARVVVRDLPSAPAAPPAPTGSSAGSHLDTGAGGDAGRSTDQHAGTRADHTARDGADHTRHHRDPVVPEVRTDRSVTDTRSAGVDLTM